MMEGIIWKNMVAMVQLLLLIAITSSSPARQEQQGMEVQHRISRRSLDLADVHDMKDDTRLPSTIIPLHYKLQFNPNLEEATFRGNVQITFICNAETDSVTLHADKELVVTQMQLDVVDSTNLESVVITGKSRDADKEWLVITLAKELHIGVHYQLTLNFNGKLQTEQAEGFIRGSYQYSTSTSNETRWFAGINTVRSKARSVFPCFDEPVFKTPYEVSVARKDGYQTLANTPLRASEPDPDDATWVLDHFITTPPISTFSVGVFVSDFVSVTPLESHNNNVAVQVFGRPGTEVELQTAADVAVKLLTSIEDYLGMPYPFSKLDIVRAPEHTQAERANYAGLLIFLEHELMGEYGRYSLSTQVANQWLGHMTSLARWNDAAEAIAINKFVVVAHGTTVPSWSNQKVWLLFYSFRRTYIKVNDLVSRSARAQWTLQMLNYTLSEETFKRGLLHFLEDRKFKSYTLDNLWNALDSTASNKGTDLTISEIVRPWLEDNRIPVIKITRNYEARTANIEQHVFIGEYSDDVAARDRKTWPIPIMYITEDNQDVSSLRPVTWMQAKKICVTYLPEANKFIVANPGDIGMFLVNYDQRNWDMIAQYLAEDPSRMAMNIRNTLLHDAWNLGYAGELDFNSVLNMTLFLPKETTLTVWDNFLNMLGILETFLDGTEAGKKFNEYYALMLTNIIGSPSEPTLQQYEEVEIRDLARIGLSWLSNVLYEQREGTYKQWIESMDPSEYIYPENRAILCTIIKWGSNDEWDLSMNKLLNVTSTADASWRETVISRIAGCSRHDEQAHRLLKAVFLENADLFTDNDREIAIGELTPPYVVIRSRLAFLTENWDALKHSLEHKPELWKLLVAESTGHLKTQEDLDKVVALYEARKEEFGVAKGVIEIMIARVRKEVEWSNRNHPVIEAWLDHKLAEMQH